MKRVTVNVADEVGAKAEAIAEERGISVSQFYAEAAEAAIRRYKHPQVLQRIEDEIIGTGASVPREGFEEAQEDLRDADSHRR